MNEFGFVAVINFYPQPAYGHIDDICIAIEIHVPHLGRNHGARQHLALAAQQQFQQRKFLGRQVDALARDAVHAVELANDTQYGLSAAVFTKDIAKGLTIARQIQSGICHVNGPTVHDEAQMPFGGVKASGYGRFGGKAGIAEFTELRWITIETGPQHYPI